MRLDKFVSQAAGISRSQVKKALRQAAVAIDGDPVANPAQAVAAGARITLHGRRLTAPKPQYVMLNKPAGYVCATRDSDHPTVIDLIAEPGAGRLQIAGRLDRDTTGLVLLTDDGQWNHRVTAPARACLKTYTATLAEPLADKWIAVFAAGVRLKADARPTQPAKLQILEACRVRLSITEGRYHQVKRMFAATGNRVLSLHRESIGALALDPDLQAGQYRPLSTAEIAGF
ncbi:16S rRNA pseudouridine(516) synthase RsuA [Exilibacterium tricleocarpae]|uniref:Pseudouridine synthase n=1 Tax=Exilibacterium tricleocarpae TaxID=2591008 RepID=A0A545TLH6_9GAMM|nr:16S rRNA pseudouridine(516) synthase RsuA [Exilibacterium tricleocarpae]TQV78069.1 16S rRNA pseudouridine(516) synthase RsuA [Exilibacterium tricleocarpae]